MYLHDIVSILKWSNHFITQKIQIKSCLPKKNVGFIKAIQILSDSLGLMFFIMFIEQKIFVENKALRLFSHELKHDV